ncbi:hypothetical protein DFJ77DRAFT_478396 [Powellomyces hirtus]|nr:hypothetical protein DFJ77DRAFT_478396 [Powellomyces hirtus]
MSYSAVDVVVPVDSGKEEGKISDLAKESGRKDKHATWFVGIPLTFLAPILVALALVGVVLPNSVILNNASIDSTSHLAGKYLSLLLEDVRDKTETPIRALIPIVESLVNSPAVNETLTGPWTGLENSAVIPTIVLVKDKFKLDSLLCFGTAFKANVSVTLPVTTAHAHEAWVQALKDPINVSETVVSILDKDEDNKQRFYHLDPYTYQPIKPYYTLYNKTTLIPKTGYMHLGLGDRKMYPRKEFFAINAENNGMKLGLMVLQRFKEGATIPSYACAAGILVDATWNDMLRAAKPVETSVVAIFDIKLGILGSSNMIVNSSNVDPVTGKIQYALAKVDAMTLELRDLLVARYGNFTQAVAAVADKPSFELFLAGERWIVNLGVAQLSTYDQALLVAALPRSEVYGVIEKASSRSRAISIGISAAMAVVVAAIFVLVVLPLGTLARQMDQLTKLNFGTLEASGALDRRSWVWELRQVQTVFATMVKAFAGAIKKNKSMIAGAAAANAPSSRGQTNSGPTVKVVRTADQQEL